MKKGISLPHFSRASSAYRGLLVLACAFSNVGLLSAASVTWTGGAGDKLWGSANNFSNNPSGPSGQDIVFANTSATSTASTVTNIVNSNVSVNSLTYNNNTTGTIATATQYQNTQINSGVTLTVAGNFVSGGVAATTGVFPNTFTTISGTGTLTVNAGASSSFSVGNLRNGVASGSTTQATLDMSGLSNFNATVTAFKVGVDITTPSSIVQSKGTLTLAQTNTITATTLDVGDNISTTGASGSVMHLGQTNTLNVGTIYVAAQNVGNFESGPGTLDFASGITSGSVTIRGTTGGTSTANMNIGVAYTATANVTGNVGPVGIVDFGTNTVDALINNLTIGEGGNSTIGTTTTSGSLSMNAGTMTVATGVLALNISGPSSGTQTGQVTGTFNLGGGTLNATSLTLGSSTNAAKWAPAVATLNISGGTANVTTLVLGSLTAPASTSTVSSNVNITGTGKLVAGGNIAEGTNAGNTRITSTVTLNGGTLDMGGYTLSTSTFNVQSGTLKNLGELKTYSGGSAVVAPLAKTTSGTLNLPTANTYTGGTTITAGKVYATNTTGSATGTGAVSVSGSGTVLGGNGKISGAVTVSSSGTLYSGGVATGTPTTGPGTGMILSGNLAVSSATLSFALSNGGSGGTHASPLTTSTYLSLTGGAVLSFTGLDSISLIDLSNGGLSMRQENSYLLVSAASNANYSGLVTTDNSGVLSLNGNGFVVGVYNGSGPLASNYTAFTFNQYGSDGVTPLTGSQAYPLPALYLYNGSLEVVPEPGTWAMMVAGFALLIAVQRRKSKLV